MDPIFLLTTLDQNYLPQLQVLLTSISVNNPKDTFVLILLHSGIPEKAMEGVRRQCGAYGYSFLPIRVDDALFQGAPVTRQYPREMYYRLLAGCFLPAELDRVLYIDPDILVLNALRPLWETPMEGSMLAVVVTAS